MDFFAHQDDARKRTRRLVVLYALAVAALTAAVYAVVLIGLRVSGSARGVGWLDVGVLAGSVLGTLLVVGGGSAYRIASLAGGGKSVAELLGGRAIDSGTADPAERRALNVVEEMAIAAGCPVPPVYVLDHEDGINAFAAGTEPGNAVVGLTRGTLRTLSRDELQGVVAHEFSHILNGDMKLDTRLMGILFGILLISQIGWMIFRTTQYSSSSRSSRSSDGNQKGGNPLPLIGLALYVIGFIGVIFARLIKAAVSRQREFLADASAVQFTRNPAGLAGALRKIQEATDGSRIEAPRAEEASHLFFGEALGLSGWNPLASHPPLAERIRRIDPTGTALGAGPALEVVEDVEAPPRRRGAGAIGLAAGPGARFAAEPAAAVARVGRPERADLDHAAGLLDALPDDVRESAGAPAGARALVFALLLDREDGAVLRDQRTMIEADDPRAAVDLDAAAAAADRLGPAARLPLVELAMPALGRQTPGEFRRFVELLRRLMEADQRIGLFEYALRRVLMRHLGPRYGWGAAAAPAGDGPAPGAAASVVLSALARVGQGDPAGIESAYRSGLAALGLADGGPPLDPEHTTLESVDRALATLAAVQPADQKRLLLACAACVAADGTVTVEEGELLRAVADALGCPMPPLAPRADIAAG